MRGRCRDVVAATAVGIMLSIAGAVSAQSQGYGSWLVAPGQPLPPGSLAPGSSAAPGLPGSSLLAPQRAPSIAPTAQAAPVSGGNVALHVSARYGQDSGAIGGAIQWQVYSDRPDPAGQFRLLKEELSAAPVFLLPPGGYIVHAAFGLANSVKRVQLRAETVREVFEIPAGGVRFEGRVGDSRIPAGQIFFDLYRGTQLDIGEKRPIAEHVTTGNVVLLPEGVYHVVSNYGDANSVMRSDLKVHAGKLTDTIIVHRAAKIMLKLVSEKGGEAVANTAWSVLTPGGDVIRESIGAFPVVILAEGDYVVIARNEGKVFSREFKVEPGFDRDIEVLAQ